MKNLKLNLKKLLSLKGVALVLVLTTATTSLAGCSKKSDCSIDINHAHKYVNDDGYIRYIDKEYISYEGYTWTDDYIKLSESERDLYKFFDKKNLLRIDDNLDVILSQQEKNCDYVEYRYSYTYMMPIPHTMRSGKSTITYFTYIPTTHHSWTADANHSNLTGEQRVCHYVYTAYKVEKDENGDYVLIPSEEVDDITTVMDEYPYIKEDYYKVINLEDGVVLDYEDGPDEEEEKKQSIEAEEQSYKDNNFNNEKKLSLKY